MELVEGKCNFFDSSYHRHLFNNQKFDSSNCLTFLKTTKQRETKSNEWNKASFGRIRVERSRVKRWCAEKRYTVQGIPFSGARFAIKIFIPPLENRIVIGKSEIAACPMAPLPFPRSNEHRLLLRPPAIGYLISIVIVKGTSLEFIHQFLFSTEDRCSLSLSFPPHLLAGVALLQKFFGYLLTTDRSDDCILYFFRSYSCCICRLKICRLICRLSRIYIKQQRAVIPFKILSV